jgi:Asp-tRNA(Asn)/Glu-tRNA(Gln) amidotransferase A subunit family amidase
MTDDIASVQIADASVHTLSARLAAGRLSAVEILDAITARIEEREPELRAFTALSLPCPR